MIRPARHMDAFAMVDVLVERQKDSRYAGLVDVDQPYTRKLISSAVQRHGGTNDGATFVMVAEDGDGQVEAFVMGALDRVYGIGTMLSAQDVFLIGRKTCSPRVLTRLFRAYVDWAAGNPRVFEIGASHNDAIPGSEGFDTIYRQHGFAPCATTYRRDNEPAVKEMAA